MKQILVLLSVMFVFASYATTVNLNWTVDGNPYAQTTCETGGNLTLPAQAPTKYGYTFQGWYMNDTVIYGTGSQSGTPTPTNPVEPVWYQNGNLVLRALRNNTIADSYSTVTGKIMRRIGVRVFDGMENWQSTVTSKFYIIDNHMTAQDNSPLFSSHYEAVAAASTTAVNFGQIALFVGGGARLVIADDNYTTVAAFKQWLADQYVAGTPVTVYYPLAEPIEEFYDEQLN